MFHGLICCAPSSPPCVAKLKMTPAFLTGSCSIFGGIPLGCVECTGAELCFDGLCSFVVGGKEGERDGEGYYALTLILSL